MHMVREDYVMLQSRMGKTVVRDSNTTKLTVTVYNDWFTHGDQDCNHLQLVAVFKVTLARQYDSKGCKMMQLVC